MKIDFSQLFGNEAVVSALKKRIVSGQLSHAYLIAGPSGSGKKTLAFLTAAALCCKNETSRPCFVCPNCRKILSMQSTDLQAIGFDRPPVFLEQGVASNETDAEQDTQPKTIGVDAIRALQSDAYVKPNDLDYKFYLIGGADRMTVQAQNALLKLLEEPPSAVVFFLICENPMALLPTVRSRTQLLRMEVFDDAALQTLIQKHDSRANVLYAKDPEKLALFVRLSGGTVGAVKRYLSMDTKTLAQDAAYEAHETVCRCLSIIFAEEGGNRDSPVLIGNQGCPKPRKTALFDILTSRAETREQLKQLSCAWIAALRDLVVFQSQSIEEAPQRLFFENAEQPAALAARTDTAQLIRCIQTLQDICGSIEQNPNPQLTRSRLTELLMEIRYGSTDRAV